MGRHDGAIGGAGKTCIGGAFESLGEDCLLDGAVATGEGELSRYVTRSGRVNSQPVLQVQGRTAE